MAGVMFNPTSISRADAHYIRSGSWICKPSPTGAHYWVEVREIESGLFVCKYCLERRKFPLTFDYYGKNE